MPAIPPMPANTGANPREQGPLVQRPASSPLRRAAFSVQPQTGAARDSAVPVASRRLLIVDENWW